MYASRASQLKHFNSIKVRLEQISEISENDIFDDFNSIKVRLELLACLVVLLLYSDFNSIKVRLELLLPRSILTLLPHFNSIKVRLEQVGKLSRVREWSFQFHKGTIRTRFVA